MESVVEADPYKVTDDDGKARLASGEYYYQLDFSNIGGLVMPLVIEFTFEDGETLIERVPAEIWSKNNLKTSKVFRFEKEVLEVALDPLGIFIQSHAGSVRMLRRGCCLWRPTRLV